MPPAPPPAAQAYGMAPAPSGPASSRAGGNSALGAPQIIGLVGAGVTIVSTFLPWARGGGPSIFKYPINYLFGTTINSTTSLGIGFLVLLAGAVGVAAILIPGATVLSRIAAFVAFTIGVDFIIQTNHYASQAGVSMGSVIGVGPFFAIVGGVVLFIGKSRPKAQAAR
jgi:hypothetical protein